ncbi:trypsin-2-like [Topomyia yanbarensis]|uniref:trypsin-2-like n=1 Tax=Topomyia yanbarensis TaxID=2498891 RepID=UPI00273C9E7C|nr:trypsin-2-like [Topomyia yanbarensis]
MHARLVVLFIVSLTPVFNGAALSGPILKGGSDAPWGAFPSAAFIRTPFLSFCGAAVVHPDFVLTLAQCVYDEEQLIPIQPNQIEVIAGDRNIVSVSIERQERNVLEVIIHPNYTAYNHQNDIALLKLDRPLEMPSNTVETIVRRHRIVPDGSICELPGWSMERVSSSSLTEADQKYTTVKMLDRDICNQANIHAGRVRESMVCGGNLLSSTNAVCSGNLGCPLYCEEELTGLLSFGVNCGAPNDPPVFTQQSTVRETREDRTRKHLLFTTANGSVMDRISN